MSVVTGRGVLALVVLYRRRAEESAAFCGVREALDRAGDVNLELDSELGRPLELDLELGRRLELMVCDNSPEVQQAPAGFGGEYWRDTTNPGLARCYNRALGRAWETGAGWLMLLDHDTAVTGEYLDEVMRLTGEMEGRPEVVALVPKLVDGRGGGMSPHRPPTLRHYRGDLGLEGLVEGEICAYNSGSVLRVSALDAAGGFDEEFWLDFLDHATLRSLTRRGGRVVAMHARLTHEMSLSAPTQPGFSVRRHRSFVDAERRYYAKYGTGRERWLQRARMVLWSMLSARHRDFERAWYMMASAFGVAAAPRREPPTPDAAAGAGAHAGDDRSAGMAGARDAETKREGLRR